MAQWVKASAFGSGHDPRVLGSSPASGSLLSWEPASSSLDRRNCLFRIRPTIGALGHSPVIMCFKTCIFFKILFIYLTERERERDHKYAERQAEREEEAGSLLSREPHAGLHPRTLGS